MPGMFYIVGPTAAGKSELAAELASDIGAEIVSADAFQIYRGLDLLTAKPDSATLAKAPHHLIGSISPGDEMNAEKFRNVALRIISEIHSRNRSVILVGGSGFYVKALTDGLSTLPTPDPKLRAELAALSLDELRNKLLQVDPKAANAIDMKNRRRISRAVEICVLSGKPISEERAQSRSRTVAENTSAARPDDPGAPVSRGVFVFRDRKELYDRINKRVEAMFKSGVVEEVRAAGKIGETASQMIGWREIRAVLEGKMSIPQCIAEIQQATRRYAKRQLTWFRRQTNFEPLNLSLLTHNEARISLTARLAAAQGND